MQLTVVGNRAGMPADGAASSGYLVQTERSNILLDCGPGIAVLLGNYLHASRLDAVVVTHLHLDHCYDVLPIGKQAMRRSAGAPERRIPLFVPTGARARLDRLAELFPVRTMPELNRAFDLAYDVVEYEPHTQYALPDCTIEFVPMAHSEPDHGVRVVSPAGSLAFTGDTGWTDNLTTLASGVDIFLAECTLAEPDRTEHGHLSATEVGRAAATARARSVVLTHFGSPASEWQQARRAEAAAEFDGPVAIARPNMVFTVPADVRT